MEDYDEGFMRNIRTLAGDGEMYAGMGDSPLKAVVVSEDKTRVVFSFEDGSEARFKVVGDCCSRSWIEHLDVPPDCIGELLTGVSDARISKQEEADYEYLQVYNTKFMTAKGTIVLEYRNSSNGYYGGYLERE